MKGRDFNVKAAIVSMGSYLPNKILTNEDFEKMVETSNEWIVTRTGVKERRIATDEHTSDMGTIAAQRAIDKAPQDIKIDLIIVATTTPDYIFPNTASVIQKNLKLNEVPAFDIQVACSGCVYALSIAKGFVESGMYKNVLVIAAEKLSSIVNYEDRNTCVLFGDGASACIVSAVSLPSPIIESSTTDLTDKNLTNATTSSTPSLSEQKFLIEDILIGADGSLGELLTLPAGGCRMPPSHETVDKKLHFIQMSGIDVFRHAVKRMELACTKLLEKNNFTNSDINWVIPHQANERIIEALARKFSLPPERVYREDVRKYGNTSAASVGIALDSLLEEKKFVNGERILIVAFGAGFTWGSAILRVV